MSGSEPYAKAPRKYTGSETATSANAERLSVTATLCVGNCGGTEPNGSTSDTNMLPGVPHTLCGTLLVVYRYGCGTHVCVALPVAFGNTSVLLCVIVMPSTLEAPLELT